MSSTSPAQAPGTNLTPAPPLPTSPPLLVQKLSARARTPTRGSAFAAGYDIYSAIACVIPKRGKGLVDTDISIAVGEGCCGLIMATEVGRGLADQHRWQNSTTLGSGSQAFHRHRGRRHRLGLQRTGQSAFVQPFRGRL